MGLLEKKQRHNKGHDNIKNTTFRDRPENINMKGRPKKLINKIIDDLKERGYEAVKESQIVDAFSLLLQLPQDELKRLADDKESPYFIRLVIKHMAGGKRDIEMLDRILDRSFGKVMMRQIVDATVSQKPEPKADSPDKEALLSATIAQLEEIDNQAENNETPSNE